MSFKVFVLWKSLTPSAANSAHSSVLPTFAHICLSCHSPIVVIGLRKPMLSQNQAWILWCMIFIDDDVVCEIEIRWIHLLLNSSWKIKEVGHKRCQTFLFPFQKTYNILSQSTALMAFSSLFLLVSLRAQSWYPFSSYCISMTYLPILMCYLSSLLTIPLQHMPTIILMIFVTFGNIE